MGKVKKEKNVNIRVTEEEKEWFEDMAEKYQCSETEVFRFLWHFSKGLEKKKDRPNLLKGLTYELAELCKQSWEYNDAGKQALKKTG